MFPFDHRENIKKPLAFSCFHGEQKGLAFWCFHGEQKGTLGKKALTLCVH